MRKHKLSSNFIFTLHVVFFLSFSNVIRSQCTSNSSICTSGTAGPFNFGNGGPPVSNCLAWLTNSQFAYILLYITSPGALNLYIDGNGATGFLDVAIFNIPQGVAPCTAIQNLNNQIGCNFADFSNGCNQFGTSFNCTSSVPAPNVTAGQVVMIVVEDYGNGPSSNFTLQLGSPGAQTGPPNTTVTPLSGPLCNLSPPVQLQSANMGGTWTGTGVSSSGLFNPTTAGVGIHNITYTLGQAPCQSVSTISIEVTSLASPTVTTIQPTCSSNGIATIANFSTSQTYTFSPVGPTVGTGGVITGMSPGTNYTVTTNNGSCTSAPSSSFNIAAQLTIPTTPTVTTSQGTCSSSGGATVSNYSASLTYTFDPIGPTLGSNGVISGMANSISYTITAANTTCSSLASSSFSASPQLITPDIPSTNTIAATCATAGSTNIDNFNGSLTYTFSPTGPTVDATGFINGMTAGLNYTVTAGNSSCTSLASSAFSISVQLVNPNTPTINILSPNCYANGSATISNYDNSLTYSFSPTGPNIDNNGAILGLVVGSSYTITAQLGTCLSNASSAFSIDPQLTTPDIPTTITYASTCSADGYSEVNNYDGNLVYTFSPTGPSVVTTGTILGLTVGTNYTITAGNGSCISAQSIPFTIAGQLVTPPVPAIIVTAANCSGNGNATISNFSSSSTYTFSPLGPSVGSSGLVSGLIVGSSYIVTSSNSNCISNSSAPFSISSQLPTPNIPTSLINSATCFSPGSAEISNYVSGLIYTFSPAGPSVATSGSIMNLTTGTNYTVTAGNGSCASLQSLAFNIDDQLVTPPAPTVYLTAATCSGDGTATITNYNSSLLYNFTPSGPSVGSGGGISGMVTTVNYTVTAENGSCISIPSNNFNINAQIIVLPVPFQVDQTFGCSLLTVSFSANNDPTLQYKWISNGIAIGNGSDFNSVFTEADCYDITLQVTDNNGCMASLTTDDMICVYNNPNASFTAYPNILENSSETVKFTNYSIGATTYNWDFGDTSVSNETNPSHLYNNISSNIQVTLTAESPEGCIGTNSLILYYKQPILIYIPNSFTPDQDEFNQTWGPVFTQGFDPYNFDLYVFNRWGEIIWESHDSKARWDGTNGLKGRECEDGIYTWKISYKPIQTDEKINLTGSVQLIR